MISNRLRFTMIKMGKVTFLGFVLFLIMILIIILSWIIREAWLWAFYPMDLPIAAKITDFGWMEIETKDDCEGFLTNDTFGAPLIVDMFGVPGGMSQIHQTTSDIPFRFQLEFNQSQYKIISVINGNPRDSIVSETQQDSIYLDGTATFLSADLSNLSVLNMNQYLCSSEIELSHRSPNFYLADIGTLTKGTSAIRTSQNIMGGEQVVVNIKGKISIPGQLNETLDEVQIIINADDSDETSLTIGVEGQELNLELPHFISVASTDTDEVDDLPSGTFRFERFLLESIAIGSPVGQVQFGSFAPIILDNSLTNSSFVELELPESPVRLLGGHGGLYFLSGNMNKNTLIINGTTSRIVYRKQEYGISNWQKLPAAAQGVIFTLLGSTVTSLVVTIRGYFKEKQDKKLRSLFIPQKGNFVCVMDSGYLICGTLVEKPGFWFPYYVLSSAHRKYKNDGAWEEKGIALINIRASRVEQTYFIE